METCIVQPENVFPNLETQDRMPHHISNKFPDIYSAFHSFLWEILTGFETMDSPWLMQTLIQG